MRPKLLKLNAKEAMSNGPTDTSSRGRVTERRVRHGEAALIDGASPWRTLRSVTLPLLLVSVGPLLIASFAFNFNNFGLIYLLTGGGPFSSADSSQGGTDLLITYAFRLAFGSRGADFGFASAISIFIFAIVALL